MAMTVMLNICVSLSTSSVSKIWVPLSTCAQNHSVSVHCVHVFIFKSASLGSFNEHPVNKCVDQKEMASLLWFNSPVTSMISFFVENFFFLHVQIICFVCLFCCFMSQVNSYGHGGAVSSPNHTFSWASLSKQLTTLSHVTRMIQRKGRLLLHPLSRIVIPVYEVGEAV